MTDATLPKTAIIGPDDPVLVTGANGFIGVRVVFALLQRGHRRVRCLVRPSSDATEMEAFQDGSHAAASEIVRGDLLSREDCARAVRDAAVVYHLAAGTDTKSFAEAFLHSVVTTRNLIEACFDHGGLRRLVNVSSFAVYSNRDKPNRRLLDEACPLERDPVARGEAYCYGKLRQEELVAEYGRKHSLPYVLVRPGAVYGPGRTGVTGRVGSSAFGIFLHLGGANVIPFTYVDNCAEAIVLAGLTPGVDGEAFNVVDDDLPTSREFLRLYKRHVRTFRSVPVPGIVSRGLCSLWEQYSRWSGGQLPPVFNHRAWHAYWKASQYSNAKLKRCLGWQPATPTREGLNRYFAYCQERARDA